MSAPAFDNPITQQLADFLNGIGIGVRRGEIQEETFLPGIRLEDGGMVVDEGRLSFPGDMLHEAGHLAVIPPDRRRTVHINAGDDAAEEMMAIAWSYAAAVHLGLDIAILFHEHGYRGGSAGLIENFSRGRYFGVPMLQWVGLAMEPGRESENGIAPYPHMIRWLRE